MAFQLIFKRRFRFVARRKRNEGDDALAFQLIGATDDSSFSDSWMAYQRTLDFHCSNTMTRDIDHIINTAHDPEVAVFISPGAIAGEIHAWHFAPLLFLVALGISVNVPQHRWPRAFDDKKSSLICSVRISLPIDDIGDNSG